jgi:hypothetical protein
MSLSGALQTLDFVFLVVKPVRVLVSMAGLPLRARTSSVKAAQWLYLPKTQWGAFYPSSLCSHDFLRSLL